MPTAPDSGLDLGRQLDRVGGIAPIQAVEAAARRRSNSVHGADAALASAARPGVTGR
jgi:hypothetical protein